MANSALNNHCRAAGLFSLLLLCGASNLVAQPISKLDMADNPTWDSKSLTLDGKTNLLVLPDFHLKTQSGYTIDAGEALASVADGRSALAFILNPTTVAQVWDVATSGNVMPQKSTYFYPKLLTGLVTNPLD